MAAVVDQQNEKDPELLLDGSDPDGSVAFTAAQGRPSGAAQPNAIRSRSCTGNAADQGSKQRWFHSDHRHEESKGLPWQA